MATIKKVPAVRFKSFEEEWEEKKLGEIFDCDIPTNTLSRANLNNNQGEIKNIHYGDILIKYNSCLNISENNIPYITGGNIVDFKHHFLKNGDIIFADAAEDEMVGKSIEICNVGNDFVVTGLHTIATRPIIKFQKYYLGYYLNSNSFHDQLISLMQGTKVLSISKNNLKKALLNYPVSSEQSQIGDYFKELDDLIQLQEQKLKKVTNLKKAMLEKMFPKENADEPEIRFKGFMEKWEKKKLGEVADSFGYGLNSAAINYDGINKYIRITDIDENSHQFNIDALTSPNVNLTNADNYKLKNGDILFARTGASVGKTYHYNENDGLVYFAGFLIRARIKSDTDSEFVFQNTLRSEYSKFIKITSQRSGQPGVNAKEYSDYAIKIPSLKEQQKIGIYFQNLDQLISQTKQKIQQLKHLKQALLQKMFI